MKIDDSKNLIPYDKLGHEIKVNSYIAYGHALGRCAGLRIGKVLRILHEPANDWSSTPIWKIKVWGVNDDWTSKPLSLTRTSGILNFPNRMLVVNEKQVPESYISLLSHVNENTKQKDIKEYIS